MRHMMNRRAVEKRMAMRDAMKIAKNELKLPIGDGDADLLVYRLLSVFNRCGLRVTAAPHGAERITAAATREDERIYAAFDGEAS